MVGLFILIKSMKIMNFSEEEGIISNFLTFLMGILILVTPINYFICSFVKKILSIKIFKDMKIYNNLFKENIILEILKNFYSDVKYFPKTAMSSTLYNQSGLSEYYDIYEADDYFEAIEKNKYDVMMSEIKTQRIVKNDNVTSYRTVFHGLFAMIEIDETINCDLKIVKNGWVWTDNKLELDSMKFEQYFDVECTDKIRGMQILTVDVMEVLIDVYNTIGKNFDISIKNNIIYLRLNTGPVFETSNISKNIIDKEALKYYYNMLKIMNNLIDKITKIIRAKEHEIS